MKNTWCIIGIMWLLMTACGGSPSHPKEGEHNVSAELDYAEPSPEAPLKYEEQRGKIPSQTVRFDSTPSIKQPAQLIKTADMRIKVADYEKTSQDIKALVAQHKGYVAASDERNELYQIQAAVTIRVPAAEFEPLLEGLRRTAVYVHQLNISSQDVTEEYVDIQARIKSKLEVEKRYVDLLKQAKNVTEILEVEEKLRQLREEIEAKQGRLNYLKDQVGYSTIQLTYYKPYENYTPAPGPSFLLQAKEAFLGGWQGFVAFLVGMIYLWPFLIIIGIACWWLFKRWRNKRKPPTDAA
jgi:hypothetical protein